MSGVTGSDTRIALPAACAWLAAALLVGQPRAAVPTVVVGAVIVVGAALVLWAVRSGPDTVRVLVALVLTAAALVALVAVAIGVGEVRRQPDAVRSIGPGAVGVQLTLDRDLTPRDRSVLGTLRAVEGAVGAGGAAALRVPVRVVPAADSSDRPRTVAAGSSLAGRATVQPDDPGSPTAFVVFLRGTPRTQPPTGFLAATDRARQAFVRVSSALPEPGASLLRGLAIGDRSGLDEDTQAAMETAALTHLTAVSGSNCAVIVALVVVLGRACGLPRVIRAAVAVALLLAFVVLVRPDPSIVRATVMAVIVLVVHLTGRPVRGVPVIALAVVGMLVVDPWTARSFAFTLSVLATSGIVVLGPPLADLVGKWVWKPFAAVLAVPVSAQLACWPATIPLAAALPTYAVPANLLTEPLAPVVTVIGLGACLLAPVWPDGASVLAGVAWAPASAIGVVAHTAAKLPFASAPWPGDGIGVAAAAGVSVAVAVAVLVTGMLRRWLVLAAGAVVVIGVASVALPVVVARGSIPDDWSIAACDVGQGDAILLRGGNAIGLVDTGDDPERLHACLDLLGVERIDLLVLTHFDRDHVGAVGTVAGSVRTALVGPTGRAADERIVRDLQHAGVDVRRGSAGVSGELGPLTWRVLWPSSGDVAAGNAASVVLRTDPGHGCVGCVSSLLLGDLGETAQRRLLATGLDPVDVVKVAHHGAADQDPALYEQVAAPVGLIGVGADNTYGHPTTRALDMLRAAGTTAFRTDRQGTVVVRAGADGAVRICTERGSSAAARRIEGAPPEGTHARQEARARRREDRPGPVVGHPAVAGRAHHRAGTVPGRAGEQCAPRPARRRGPRARGPRPRSRPVRSRVARDPREPVALRRTAARARDQRREVHRRVHHRDHRVPRGRGGRRHARAPPRRWDAGQEAARHDPQRGGRWDRGRVRRTQARDRPHRIRQRRVPRCPSQDRAVRGPDARHSVCGRPGRTRRGVPTAPR
ncbi:ComEC/Rec2 family competence protein [Curtobacterium sp. ISL-83]|nr:ComEC/Rec2 family competence protein [Curtobacterium sp. ISL-83]